MMPGLPQLFKVHRSHSRLPDDKLRDLENWIDSVASSSRLTDYNKIAPSKNGFPDAGAICSAGGTDDESSEFDSDQGNFRFVDHLDYIYVFNTHTRTHKHTHTHTQTHTHLFIINY